MEISDIFGGKKMSENIMAWSVMAISLIAMLIIVIGYMTMEVVSYIWNVPFSWLIAIYIGTILVYVIEGRNN